MFAFILFTSIIKANYNIASIEKTTLSGNVINKKTKEVLPGVIIYFPDLKIGTATKADGSYSISDLPKAKVIIQITIVGYKTLSEMIDLTTILNMDFELEETVAELNEVVVTGLSQATERNRTPTPITTMSSLQLKQISATNIIDAIATQPGISQITTGAGISKPVIRGLGYNRVVVVNDGIRQEGQQWGDEHGIEIDEFSVGRVEILKGPASLSYGSDAMAGVINFISSPTLPEGKIIGNLLANYQTNNGLYAYSANIAGNKKGIIWDIRYSNKQAHAYQNKQDGYVLNSGFKEDNFGGIIGINKAWGYSHLHFSKYNFSPGIVEGERDSVTGNFIKPIALSDSTISEAIANSDDYKSYSRIHPFQKIKHQKIVLNNNFIVGNASIKAILGWQQNHRQEYEDVLNPNKYGLYFLLNTFNYDLRYVLPEKNNWNISLGINGMQQHSQNKGVEYLVPEYKLFDIGGFTIIRKSFEKLDISGGLRYDLRNQTAAQLLLDKNEMPTTVNDSNATFRFTGFKKSFAGYSGSIGLTYQFTEHLFSKINLSRGYRSPNIAELAANGLHDGTTRYEIGNANLKPENSLQFDYALGINTTHITAELNLFSNDINNFIFLSKLNSYAGGDSLNQGYQTFEYRATNANLTGGEFSLDIHPHPLDWLHFENSIAIVIASIKNQTDSTKYFPFTPAPKYSSQLMANILKPNKFMRNSYLKLGVDYYFKQDKIYAAYNTETVTPAYTLINIGFGSEIIRKEKTLFSIFFSINNLTDVSYQSHLSRLKYLPENYTNNTIGVYNMGRTISVKLLIPIVLKG
jgi:iron complex outermembrane receptor protein